jgi:gas vesicle protein
MFIKLGIIVGIVILGGMIFSNEIDSFLPTTSATVFDSLKNDMNIFGTKALDSVEQRIDSSIDKIVNKTSESISNEISNVGDKVSNEISDVKESSQKLIKEEVSNFDPIKSIQNIFTGSSNLDSVSQSSNVATQNIVSIIPGTLSLSTKQQSDDNILLQYLDTTGKTKSVNVVIRTADREIFSGTFYTSVFDTNVNDATGIPYYVDMIVEHEDYGTVTSSVFNPGDSSDTKINGIFSQS